MGTCCNAHLATKVRDYAKNAQNGAVTVTVIENPQIKTLIKTFDQLNPKQNEAVIVGYCDYCKAPADFCVSYYPKRP